VSQSNSITSVALQVADPSVGPKVYNARGIFESKAHLKDPSTFLHLDLCSAINVMLWSQEGYDGVTGAEWMIFRREDTGALRRFLNSHFERKETEIDPIHSQYYYFDDALLITLEDAEGIRPFHFKQEMGEAVLIPAGCPHQVEPATYLPV
jgi:hypothetical protein